VYSWLYKKQFKHTLHTRQTEKCASGRIEQQCLNEISNHLSKNSIKSSTLSLQTAWTMNSLDETECASSWLWVACASIEYKRPCGCYFPPEQGLMSSNVVITITNYFVTIAIMITNLRLFLSL